ncbi:MAG: SPASM domain-containing protein, partial [Candidatus Thiodiazotropha endolucinida]|nr:SPASM domain-containing protein [Candidatus Thiodiazotropha taylori]MCW4239885.1 SPASM domain-containing protein [Candidatus Thiodiazotropha taylori]
CQLQSSIVTNGMLLDSDTSQQLYEAGISHIQITLDGDKPIHDKRRITKKGFGTYERILTSLETIPPGMKLHIRVNTDKTNLSGIGKMLKDISSRDISCDFRIYFSVLDECGEGCHGFSKKHNISLLTQDQLMTKLAEYLPLACKLGLTVQLPTSETGVCGAISRQSLVLEPDGTIKKCWKDVGSSEGAIGNIADPIFTENPEHFRWLAHDPLVIDGCPECDTFESCLGGCAWMVKHGIEHQYRCHPTKGSGFEKIRAVTKKLVNDGIAVYKNDSLIPIPNKSI